jgi:sugar lactone lactonase YvrE
MPQRSPAVVTKLAVVLTAAFTILPAGAQTTITLPDSLYTPGDTVVWVKPVPAYCEGPAWHPRTGEVTFTQIGSPGPIGNRPHWPLWRVRPGVDTGSIFYNLGQGNGQVLDPQGRLVVIQRDVVIRFAAYDVPGAAVDTLTFSGKNGVIFDGNLNNSDAQAGNDIVFGVRGEFYFTNLASNVYYVDTARTLFQVVSNASSANGIEWLEEENRVYVNEGANIRHYTRGSDGSLTNRTVWATQSGMGADGGCVDSHGNRWVGDYSGGMVRVFNAAGQSIGNITMRSVSGAYNARGGNAGNADNCVFGGGDLKTLYITGDGGLYSLRVKIAGRPPATSTAIRSFPLRNAGKDGKSAPLDGEGRDLRGRLLQGDAAGPVFKALDAPRQ